MVGRVVIILLIAMAKKVWWCLEQPKGSLLEGHDLFQKMLYLRHVSVTRVCCSLGHFGADSLKPVWIYSSNLAHAQNYIMMEFLSFFVHTQVTKPITQYFLPMPARQSPGEPRASQINDYADRSLRPSNPNMVTHYEDSSGRARVKGGSALKQSQAYPLRLLDSNGQLVYQRFKPRIF